MPRCPCFPRRFPQHRVTDGTVSGTARLVDSNPGSGSGIDNYWKTFVYDSKLYFTTNSGSNTNNDILWVTDGTIGGTQQVSLPSTTSTVEINIDQGSIFNACLFFEAQLDNAGSELWRLGEECIVGINQTEQITFQLFPNPNNGSFIIQTPDAKGKVEFTLYNTLGQTVYNSIFNGSELHAGSRIDLKGLPVGLYNATIKSGDKLATRKLFID